MPHQRSVHPVRLAVSTVIFALLPRPPPGSPCSGLPSCDARVNRSGGAGRCPVGGCPRTKRSRPPPLARCAPTTGLAPNYLEQLYTFGDVDRSPEERVVSVVYWALVQSDEAAAGDGRRRERALGSRPTPCPSSRSTTTASSSTRSGACARRSSTPSSPTRSSARRSRSPSCARSTRSCCSAASTRPTSAAR